MNFSDLVTSDMRLVILRLLAEDAGYSHNEIILRQALDLVAHRVSRDRLRTELAWLAEQSLVAVEERGGLQVAKLTYRGADVALGRTVVPGVKRPEPGEC
jgi:hypothetical protein